MGEEEKKKVEKKTAEGEGKKKEEVGEKKANGAGRVNENKEVEVKKEDGDGGEKKAEGDGEGEETPPPPEEMVMRVFMHCEGCARKVKRSLKGFEGVEEVTTDCRTHKVVVKGKAAAAADPLKVVDRVEKKTGRKVELLTPILPKPPEEKKDEEAKGKPNPVEKKELERPAMCVVLKVHMHCEACSQEIKKRILKMEGVQSVDPDLKGSQVTVVGVFEPPQLVEYVYKRTGKHAAVVKAEPVVKQPGDKGKGAKKAEGGDGDHKADAGGREGEKDKGAAGSGEGDEKTEGDAAAILAAAAAKRGEVTKNPFYYYYPKYQVEYAYPPQIFSDENPNACSVM